MMALDVSENTYRAFNQRYWLAATLVVFFGASVLVYMLIARLLTLQVEFDPTRNWRSILSIAALVIGVGVVALRRLMMSKVVLQSVAKRGTGAVLSRLTTTSIVCAALGEVIGTLGLVGYIRTGELDFSTQMGLISLLIIAYSFPRRGEWQRAVAESERPDVVK